MTPFIRKLVGTGAVLAAATPLFAHIDEQMKITASDGQPGDQFGHAVAVYQSLIAVSAPAQDTMGVESGAVYVYEQAGLLFEEQVKLLAFDGAPLDRFGASVSVSHHTIAVGAPQDDDLGSDSGAVYVYVEAAGVWSLEAKLLPSDGAAGDKFGTSVDVEGDVVIVGAPGHDLVGVGNDAGAIYVFDRSGTTWTETVKLLPADPGPRKLFGSSVALTGEAHSHAEHADNRLIVGAPQDSDVVAFGGSAYVFRELSGVWSEEVKLTDANAGENDLFGTAVDLLDGMAIVGSPKDDDFVLDGGAIFAFDETSHAWPQVQHKYGVLQSNPNRRLGVSVAITEGVVIAGAPFDESGGQTDAGLDYVWFTEETTWEGDIAAANDPAVNDHEGVSVAVSGCWMVSGADRDDELGVDAGAAYVYPTHHHLDTYCTAGTSASGCQAILGGVGIASASASSGFALYANGLEGEKDGLFYFSENGAQATPWQGSSSFQCVIPPVIRTPMIPGTGTLGLCDGLAILDLNAMWCPTCPYPAKNPGSGAHIYAQFWYRDPFNSAGPGTSLSNAIVVEVCP